MSPRRNPPGGVAGRLLRLIERLQDRRRLAFHGTSSVFARTILKQGLIPHPKRAVFGPEHAGTATAPSLAAYPGVYLTFHLPKAQTAAKVAVKKFGGNPLLIAAMVEPRSTLPDEDLLVSRLTRLTLDLGLVGRQYQASGFVHPQWKREYPGWKRGVDALMTELALDTRRIDDMLFRRVFMFALQRIAAHVRKQGVQDAEAAFAGVMHTLLVQLRKAVLTSWAVGSIRLPQGIGFHGRNHILSVVEFDPSREVPLVHYGDSQVLTDTIATVNV